MATLVRPGTNVESHASFGAIGAWIEANDYEVDGPCREVFLEPITGPPGFDEALVEIQFPVVAPPSFLFVLPEPPNPDASRFRRPELLCRIPASRKPQQE